MLRVYYAELADSFRGDDCSIPLSAYRKEKLKKTSVPLVRRQMYAAEWLLDHAIREILPDASLPPDIQTGEKGKPFLSELPYCFSLSHSGPFVACAIADHEIGADIQVRSSLHEPLLKRFFSPEEQRYVLECADRDAAFTEIWCLKESYLKATGEGLTRSLSDFSLDLSGPIILSNSDAVRFWQLHEMRFQMAVCSLVGIEQTPERIEKIELRP